MLGYIPSCLSDIKEVFDVVYLSNIVEWLGKNRKEDQEKMAAELKRILTEDCLIYSSIFVSRFALDKNIWSNDFKIKEKNNAYILRRK